MMFKKVEYAGFDSNPELKAKAEQLTPVLAGQIGRWRDDIAVTWSPQPSAPSQQLNLTLSLTLPNGVGGSALGTFSPADLSDAWLIRSRCRGVWSDLLGVLLEKQNQRVQECLLETAEA
jgi:hypothetical protein